MEHVDIIPKVQPDLWLAGVDGEFSLHSYMIATHSDLIKSILGSLSDHTESVVILPDFEVGEIITLVKVMYGVDKCGFVRGSLLNILGLEKYKDLIVYCYSTGK